MQKVLLVIDTYSDLVQLESLLKKIGFDVLGMQNAVSIQEQLLGFSPDVVVLSGRGNRIQGIELSQKIKKRKGIPKIVLLFPKGYQPQPSELAQSQMDALFEFPVDPVRFLNTLCKLLSLDTAMVMDKFAKLQGFDVGEEHGTAVQAGALPGMSPLIKAGDFMPPERKEGVSRTDHYRQIASQIHLEGPGGLDHDRIQRAVAERKALANSEQDQELDEGRREFVRALFIKAK